MKKLTALLLALCILAGLLAGCQKQNPAGKTDKLKIVTTIFPEYDWVREILGDKADNADVTMLLDNGVDLHSYQPTADDIVKISDCDLFIHVGGESDGWVEDALKNAANPNRKVINLLEVLGDGVKTEEMVEGMQENGHGHHHGHDEDITLDDIRDRPLSDFAGTWKSLHPYLLRGDLDAFCEHRAEEDEDSAATKDTYREKYQSLWQCDADRVSIDGNTITFTDADGKSLSAAYTYAGYQPKLDDEGHVRSVRYQFETADAAAPRFVQLNDHGYEPSEAGHFHIYFGSDGFDALMDAKAHPFFVQDALTAEEILDELMGHGHEEEKDEHVWLSLKNAKTLIGAISDALQALDPGSGDAYAAHAAAYLDKLSALDAGYQAVADGAARRTVLFGDRFPFRYLTDDYGLSYYAAFAGCSAESEASFETVSFLAGKTDELKLPCVLTIEGAQHKIAETIVQNTAEKNQKILTMDSMQATTLRDAANGTTYLSVMEKNLSVLQEALS